MATKLSVNELLRLACLYAYDNQLEHLDCIKGTDPQEEEKTKAFLEQIREYRLKRWGKTKLEVVLEEAKPVTVIELIKMEPWQLCSHIWGGFEDIKEPNFGVKLGSVAVCTKCRARRHEDWTAQRASSVERILPPES